MGSIRRILIAAGLAFLFMVGVASIIQGQEGRKAPADKQETKAPEKQEPKAAPEDWLRSYDEFVSLQRAILEIKRENGIDKLEERLDQKARALQAAMPAGYQFDGTKRQFVPVPKPPEPAKK